MPRRIEQPTTNDRFGHVYLVALTAFIAAAEATPPGERETFCSMLRTAGRIGITTISIAERIGQTYASVNRWTTIGNPPPPRSTREIVRAFCIAEAIRMRDGAARDMLLDIKDSET